MNEVFAGSLHSFIISVGLVSFYIDDDNSDCGGNNIMLCGRHNMPRPLQLVT